VIHRRKSVTADMLPYIGDQFNAAVWGKEKLPCLRRSVRTLQLRSTLSWGGALTQRTNRLI
jgi:hypothetical protein